MRKLLVLVVSVIALVLLAPGWGDAQVKTKPMTHDVEGKENCVMCHTPGVIPNAPDMPETHEGRDAQTCLWCHGAESLMVTQGAPQFAHDLEGRDNCVLCHAAGIMPQIPDAPASHEGREVETCLWCHTKVGRP